MNEFLPTTPFDIYELSLFRLVAANGSFTKASEIAGLTQSAITRQIQGMEKSLGIELFERTTRSVRLTPAGEFLLAESGHLIGGVEQTLRVLRERFAGARKEVRVGVASTISLAYLPGFLHANLRKLPEVACHVSSQSSSDILTGLEANALDLGVICPPTRLPRTLRITHRFDDAFTLIAPRKRRPNGGLPQPVPTNEAELVEWSKDRNWLLIDERSNTGQQLQSWLRSQGLRIAPTMCLDNFDLIINLVALGMGVSFVPIRALALYGRKPTLQRIPLKQRFVRELVVVARHTGKIPDHIEQFIGNVLF